MSVKRLKQAKTTRATLDAAQAARRVQLAPTKGTRMPDAIPLIQPTNRADRRAAARKGGRR